MELSRWFIGIGNVFIKTPFYSLDNEEEPIKLSKDSNYRAIGIHPDELFKTLKEE